MSLYTIPCVVFAGGKSSRMGKDKAFLAFAGYDSLIEYQVQRLQDIFVDVYISAKETNKFSGINATIIQDVLYHNISAPTTGLANVFEQLHTEEYFFILSVDTPFVNKKIISELIEASKSGNYEAVIVRTPLGIHPLCGIYSRALQASIKTMIDNSDHKLMKLLKNSNVHYIDVEDEVLLSNLNTPEQYEEALSKAKP